MLSAIIIEDMPDALQLLQSSLKKNHADIEVVATAQSGSGKNITQNRTRHFVSRYHAR